MWNYKYSDELYHYGVMGMKWGVRKTKRVANRDAKEFARAKMFYGKGAGNRRKLINNIVNQRSKDPTYKKFFDEALEGQDMTKHVAKAKAERRVRDIPMIIAGVSGSVATIGTLLHATGTDKILIDKGKTYVNMVLNNLR